ncbi:hypothetical protein SAE02_74590 [Skermanella aerolata]|uniref:Uncharacterized protein n=1 Tax=Skermanella aerolata TaxID=393310 RepID=A0A512E3J1_9PROT|nr:hypothetical protein [Skermanella aerolata]KJB90388.1 hypothetical protein N826_41475 [Skermanella aerolata KACC 11604]GEO43311.1 hypothetical protein SAE02_74590 [Skermanella aerolata]
MAIGARFAKWEFGLFVFGVFLTFGIIGHYCSGARWPTGELFLQNITLWWACPWTLSVGYPGHFVFDAIWPAFYYSPVAIGRNAWLLGQGFFVVIYFAGAVMMFDTVRRRLNTISSSFELSSSRVGP